MAIRTGNGFNRLPTGWKGKGGKIYELTGNRLIQPETWQAGTGRISPALILGQVNDIILNLIHVLPQVLDIKQLSMRTTLTRETRLSCFLNGQMTQPAISVMEHLKGFSAVNLDADAAAAALEETLQQFGPVGQSRLATFQDALEYLLPIKSFTTRYVVMGLGEWSILLTDMRGANCYVEAFAISRARHCKAIGLFLQQKRRELHVFENERKVRQVQSLSDGNRWYFREEGVLQPFEDAEECVRRKKQDRLSAEALRHYFQTYTDLTIPDWKNTSFTHIFGLARCTKGLRVAVSEFETVE